MYIMHAKFHQKLLKDVRMLKKCSWDCNIGWRMQSFIVVGQVHFKQTSLFLEFWQFSGKWETLISCVRPFDLCLPFPCAFALQFYSRVEPRFWDLPPLDPSHISKGMSFSLFFRWVPNFNGHWGVAVGILALLSVGAQRTSTITTCRKVVTI